MKFGPCFLCGAKEFIDEAFGDVGFRDDRDQQAGVAGGGGGSFADGGDFEAGGGGEGKAEGLGAVDERVHSVGAGEDQPVVVGERAQGAVESGEGVGRLNFEDGNLDGVGAEGAKAFAELAGLVGGARDEDRGLGAEVRSFRCLSSMAPRIRILPCPRIGIWGTP